MISEIKEYSIKCDKCHSYLEYPDTHSLVSYRGHTIFEDTRKNIETVAINYGWTINTNKHICSDCK